MEIRLDFKSVSGPSPAPSFNKIAGDGIYPDLFDAETNSTGIDCTISNFGSGNTIGFGGSNPPVGDASWVPIEVSATAQRTAVGGSWSTITLSGSLNPSSSYMWELYGVASSGTQELICRVNGGATQQMPIAANDSNTLVFSGLSVVNGEIVVEVSGTTTGDSYVGAGRLIEEVGPPTPTVTIDTEMAPGGTSVLTYSNFDAAPTGTVTATPLDGSGDPISGFTPLTYTGTVSDTDTAGVHSGTVTVNWPALVDGQTTLPFGTNNVRLSITS